MSDAAAFGEGDRIRTVALRDPGPARSPELQQEIDLALYDLREENRFRLADPPRPGPYEVAVGLEGGRLVLEVSAGPGAPARLEVPLSGLRELVEDYGAVCDRYFGAVRRLPRSEIEAIEADRRAVHEEGARQLRSALAGRAETDHATARRLFTLLCALAAR